MTTRWTAAVAAALLTACGGAQDEYGVTTSAVKQEPKPPVRTEFDAPLLLITGNPASGVVLMAGYTLEQLRAECAGEAVADASTAHFRQVESPVAANHYYVLSVQMRDVPALVFLPEAPFTWDDIFSEEFACAVAATTPWAAGTASGVFRDNEGRAASWGFEGRARVVDASGAEHFLVHAGHCTFNPSSTESRCDTNIRLR